MQVTRPLFIVIIHQSQPPADLIAGQFIQRFATHPQQIFRLYHLLNSLTPAGIASGHATDTSQPSLAKTMGCRDKMAVLETQYYPTLFCLRLGPPTVGQAASQDSSPCPHQNHNSPWHNAHHHAGQYASIHQNYRRPCQTMNATGHNPANREKYAINPAAALAR